MKMKISYLCLTINFFFLINLKAQLPGFVLTGDPATPSGATWTYSATVNSVVYNLKGLLYKPAGSGPFSSVIINHGTGGNTASMGYSDKVAKEMVTWGYVSIATNYCHMGTSGSYPCGSPGDCSGTTMVDWGASTNNFLRVLKVWDILASFAYTDTNCVGIFGHSRGSFLTTGVVGVYPHKFSVAGHTAGGFGIPDEPTMPTLAMVNGVNIPYIIHHGDLDTNVPLIKDAKLDSVLTKNAVLHQYYVYTNYYHNDIPYDPLMYSRTKTFFNQYICSPLVGLYDNGLQSSKITFFPNPSNEWLSFSEELFDVEIVNIYGQVVIPKTKSAKSIDLRNIAEGVYFIKSKGLSFKFIVQH